MTTQPGEGGKQAASPNDTTHLISDHDNIGEPRNWCGAESFQTSESLAEVTCLLCLKAAQIYGEGAATRLHHLEAPAIKCEDCEQSVSQRVACNDYQVTNEAICPTCGHEYFCHEESRMEGEE